jgi:hypothetical protein
MTQTKERTVLACIEPLDNLRPARLRPQAFAPPRHFYVLLANHGDIRVAFHRQNPSNYSTPRLMWRLTFPANAQICLDHANSYQNAVAFFLGWKIGLLEFSRRMTHAQGQVTTFIPAMFRG